MGDASELILSLPSVCLAVDAYELGVYGLGPYFLSMSMNVEGRTNSAATKDMSIIKTVSIPKEENIGMGARAIIAKPNMVEAAAPNNAEPHRLAAHSRAALLSGAFFIYVIFCSVFAHYTLYNRPPLISISSFWPVSMKASPVDKKGFPDLNATIVAPNS